MVCRNCHFGLLVLHHRSKILILLWVWSKIFETIYNDEFAPTNIIFCFFLIIFLIFRFIKKTLTPTTTPTYNLFNIHVTHLFFSLTPLWKPPPPARNQRYLSSEATTTCWKPPWSIGNPYCNHHSYRKQPLKPPFCLHSFLCFSTTFTKNHLHSHHNRKKSSLPLERFRHAFVCVCFSHTHKRMEITREEDRYEWDMLYGGGRV